MHGGECPGFIPVPQFVLQARRRFADEGFHDSMISNNPLAVELETENDAPWEFFNPTFSSLPSI
jgi:hypothetical protein